MNSALILLQYILHINAPIAQTIWLGWAVLRRYWLVVQVGRENLIWFGQLLGRSGQLVGWANLWVLSRCWVWGSLGRVWRGKTGRTVGSTLPPPSPSTSHHPNSLSFPQSLSSGWREGELEANYFGKTSFGGLPQLFKVLEPVRGGRDIWAVQSDMFTGDHPLTLLRWPAPGWNLSSLPLSYYSLVSLPHSLGHWKWDLTTLIHMVCCNKKVMGNICTDHDSISNLQTSQLKKN